jgi:hypothetical protein
MAKVKVKTDTEIEWNGKVKTLKAGVEYNLPADLAKKVKPAPVRKKKVPADGQH